MRRIIFLLSFIILSVNVINQEKNEIAKYFKGHNVRGKYIVILNLERYYCDKCYQLFFEIIQKLDKETSNKIEVLATLKCVRDIEIKNFVRKYNFKYNVLRYKKDMKDKLGLKDEHIFYLMNPKYEIIYQSDILDFDYDKVKNYINKK